MIKDIDTLKETRVFGGFLVLNTKYTAFAGCPPGSDTSHVRGLVDPSGLRQLRTLLVVLMLLKLQCGVQYSTIVSEKNQGDTLKETKESQRMLYMRMSLLACRGSL